MRHDSNLPSQGWDGEVSYFEEVLAAGPTTQIYQSLRDAGIDNDGIQSRVYPGVAPYKQVRRRAVLSLEEFWISRQEVSSKHLTDLESDRWGTVPILLKELLAQGAVEDFERSWFKGLLEDLQLKFCRKPLI